MAQHGKFLQSCCNLILISRSRKIHNSLPIYPTNLCFLSPLKLVPATHHTRERQSMIFVSLTYAFRSLKLPTFGYLGSVNVFTASHVVWEHQLHTRVAYPHSRWVHVTECCRNQARLSWPFSDVIMLNKNCFSPRYISSNEKTRHMMPTAM